jgi:hypothetical protein
MSGPGALKIHHRDTETQRSQRRREAPQAVISMLRNIYVQGHDCLRRFWFSVISVSLCLCGEKSALATQSGL